MKPFFRRSGLVGLLGATALAAGQAQAAATILLWHINPWLSAEARATELWIQNQGNSATTMQIRIVRWKQEGGYERYTAQQDVVASPPIVTIAKGSKQLIRLIKQGRSRWGLSRPTALLWMKFPAGCQSGTVLGPQTANALFDSFICLWAGDPHPQRRGAPRAGEHPTAELAGRSGGGKPALQVRNQGMFMSGSARLRLSRAGKSARLPRGCWVMCCRQHPKLAASGRDLSAEPDERAN